MTRITTICCSAIALLALAKAPEPMGLVPLRPIWKLALNNHVTFPGAYDDSRGFFALDRDQLVAYDMASGKQLWLVEARPLHRPVAGNDFVYIVDAEGLLALHANDGRPAWRKTLKDPLVARPTAGKGWLVAATKAGELIKLRAADGEILWSQNTRSPLHAAATIRGDRLYASTVDSRILAYDIESGKPLWERRIAGSGNEILALPERLFVGSTDNFLYCLMASDGRIDWRWRTGGDILAAPVADSRAVYFVSFDNLVRSLSIVSGGQHWMKPLPFRPTSGVLIAGSTVIVGGPSPAIKTFNAKDGAPGPDIAAGDEVATAPTLLEDRQSGLPMLAIVTRHIVNGDSVSLNIRSLEPAATPFAGLPNPVTPSPMQPTRQ